MKTFRHLLCLCLLLFPLAGKAQWQPVQEQEDNNTPEHAQLLPNASRITGSLGYETAQGRDYYDYFKIELADDGKIELACHFPKGLRPYAVYLHEEKNNQLGDFRAEKRWSGYGCEPYTDCDTTVYLRCDGLAKGTYYIEVKQASGWGGYTLDYTHTSCATHNDAEPNDVPSKATPIESGQQISGRLGYKYHRYTDGSDYYEINIPDDGKTELACHFPKGLRPYAVYLYEEKDNKLGDFRAEKRWSGYGCEPYTDCDTIVYLRCDGLAKGTYYIEVKQATGWGGYTLDYTHTSCATHNDAEPNDVPSNAIPVESGQQISGRLGYKYHRYTDGSDYYEINIPDDGKMELACHFPKGLRPYAVYLHEEKNNQLGDFRAEKRWSGYGCEPYTDCDTTVYLRCDGLAKGTYYIEVKQATGWGGYTLDYTHTSCATHNDAEPNDVSSNAIPVESGQQISGRLGYKYHGDTDGSDYYKINIPDDGKIELACHFPKGLRPYAVYLHEEKNNKLGDFRAEKRWSGYGSEEYTDCDTTVYLRCDGLAKGTYYIEVKQATGWGGYTLDYTHTSCATHNDAEPNDVPSNAIPAESGQQISGRLGYKYHGDTDGSDYYKINIPNDGKIELACHFPKGLRPYAVYLHEEKNNKLGDFRAEKRWSGYGSEEYTDCDTTVYLRCDGLAKGTYYIEVKQASGWGGYKLNYQFKPNPFSETNAVHNSYATRAKLNYGEAYSSAMGYTYHGVTTIPEEWYTLDTENVQTLSLQIDRNKEIFLRATLCRVDGMNEDGTPALRNVLSNNLEGFTTALTYNIPEADRNKEYVLQVGHRRGSGEYTVTHGDRRIPKASPIRISYNGRSSLRKGVPGRYAVTISNQSNQATEPFMLVVAHSKDVSLVGFNLPYMGGVEHLSINDVIHEGDSCASFIVPELSPWEKYTFEVVAEGTGDISYCPGMKDLQPKFAITGTTMLAVGAITFIGDVVADMVEDGVTEFITDKVNEKFAFNSAEAKAYAKVMGIHVNQLKEERQQEGKVMYATKAVVKTAATKFIEAFPGGKLITTAGAIAETTAAVATTLRHRLWFWIYKEIGLIDESELRVVDGKPIATAIVASWDPNEMVGPQGYGDEHYIGATRSIDYRILFENKAEAGAPAYRVRIFDELDANVFDVESVQFGSTSHDDPQYQWKMTREGNRLAWDIEGIELPPNVKAPEGEGFVSFSVRLKPNLPTGTVLANKATIIFDKNKPIETNLYKNTLDLQAPSVGRLTPDYVKGDSIIGLNFAANDELSGVGGYLLYVSKDGGEYKFFAQCQGEKVLFPIDKDKNETYKFYALAFDNVGNTNEEINPSNLVQTVTGIQRLHGDDSEVIAIYGSDGRRTTTLRPGVNILKMKNGTTKKVIVR